MGLLVGLALIIVVIAAVLWVSMGVVKLLLTLFVAGALGALADAVVPGRLPGGFLGAILAGIAGGFIGNLVLRLVGMAGIGPSLFGIDLIPTFVGALVIVGGAELVTRTRGDGLASRARH